jgi:LPXTG-site transpeptidase (sortase) family protein
MTPAAGSSAGRRRLLAGFVGLAASGLLAPRLARASSVEDPPPPEMDGPPDWIRVPRIDLNSATVDVGVVDGYYDVPWFDVGHHADSANPGQPGNSIFNGHVLTMNAGRVFYRLNALAPGDAVFVYTPAYRTGWSVTSTFAVTDDDSSFLEQTDQPRVTLYTCTGQFNFLERSYAERLVVVCQLEEVVPRT